MFNESSALLEMGEKTNKQHKPNQNQNQQNKMHHQTKLQKPWCHRDGVMSSGMYLILFLGPLVFVSDC